MIQVNSYENAGETTYYASYVNNRLSRFCNINKAYSRQSKVNIIKLIEEALKIKEAAVKDNIKYDIDISFINFSGDKIIISDTNNLDDWLIAGNDYYVHCEYNDIGAINSIEIFERVIWKRNLNGNDVISSILITNNTCTVSLTNASGDKILIADTNDIEKYIDIIGNYSMHYIKDEQGNINSIEIFELKEVSNSGE